MQWKREPNNYEKVGDEDCAVLTPGDYAEPGSNMVADFPVVSRNDGWRMADHGTGRKLPWPADYQADVAK